MKAKTLLLILATSFALSNSDAMAADDTVHYDAQAVIKQQMLDRFESGATFCAERAITGLLLYSNVRSRNQLGTFAENSCTTALQKFLIMQGETPAAAEAYAHKLVKDELDFVLRQNGAN